MKRLFPLLALLAALAALLALAGPALAHALLLRSLPEANAALDRPPAQVQLFLSEPVEPAFTEIRVFDAAGVQVDDGATRVDPADGARVQVGLRTLGDGVYTVSWRALSTVDGHVTVGSFPFAVGRFDQAALDAASAVSGQATTAGRGEIIPRWLALLGAALAAGGFLFTAYVWGPEWQSLGPPSGGLRIGGPQAVFTALRRGGLALFLAAGLAALLGQARGAAGLSAGRALFDPALGDLLFGTRYGLLWLGRVALALTLLLPAGRWEPWLRFVRPAAAAGLLLMLSLNSHAAAAPNPLLPVLSDWLHLLAMCIWVGGLIHLAGGLLAVRGLPAPARTRLAAGLVPRFSNLGLACVLLLLFTGLYNSWITVGAIDALFDTEYGRGLLLKLWIIVPLIGLAAVNLLVLRPALQAQRAAGAAGGERSLAGHLTLTACAEVALAAAVVYAAASFATVPPARTLTTRLTFNAPAEDLDVRLVITPGRVGLNQFEVRLTSAAGRSLADAREVLLRFSLLDGAVPIGAEAPLENQGDGLYAAQGAFFSMPGEWQVLVVARRAGQFDSYATFRMAIAAAGAPPLEAAGAQAVSIARWAAVLLLAAGLLFVFALRGLIASRLGRLALGALPALGLLLAGLAVFRGAEARAPAVVVNPFPPTAASLAQGGALYQQHCLACHGPAGLGDGPAALLMNPRPADLQQHMIPGVHTDGQIYEWIAEGYPGSIMPAFKDTLTDEEIWHVLNYIRTLVPGT